MKLIFVLAAVLGLSAAESGRFNNDDSAKRFPVNYVRKGPSLAPSHTKTNTPNKVQCGKSGQKRIADPQDSAKFYMCNFSGAHGIWILYSFNCPKGTNFDSHSQKCQSGYSRPSMGMGSANFQKILSDRVMAKINAMMNNNGTKTAGSSAMSSSFDSPFLKTPVSAEPKVPTKPFVPMQNNPVESSQNTNTMWSNHIKNYLKWQKQAGVTSTTTAKYPKIPGYPPHLQSFFTFPVMTTSPTTTTTAATTTTESTTVAPYLPPHRGVSKQVKAMNKIKSFAAKMGGMAEEIYTLVSCLYSEDQCDEDDNSNSASDEAPINGQESVYFRPDSPDDESPEEPASGEDAVVVHELSTTAAVTAITSAAPTMTTMAPAKEYNVFLKRPTEEASVMKPAETETASVEPKSSQESNVRTLDLEKVVEDLLKDPATLADAKSTTYQDQKPAAHGHTLFEDDDEEQDDAPQVVVSVNGGGDPESSDEADGAAHRKPRQY